MVNLDVYTTAYYIHPSKRSDLYSNFLLCIVL